MKTKFKVGDEVFDSENYKGVKGEVRSIEDSIYGIEVYFGKRRIIYTTEGKRYNYDNQPTLSHTPYKIIFEGFTQNEVCEFEKDEIVEVRDYDDQSWQLRRHTGLCTSCYANGLSSTDTDSLHKWEQIRKPKN